MTAPITIATLLSVVATAYFILLDPRAQPFIDRYRPASRPAAKVAALAHVAAVPGEKGRFKVSIAAPAAERIGLSEAIVREEPDLRRRVLCADVMAGEGGLRALVTLPSRSDAPAPGMSHTIRPLDPSKGVAIEVSGAVVGNGQIVLPLSDAAPFVPGDRVMVDVPLGEGSLRKVVPVGAVVYDPQGRAWVFARVAPLAFMRQPVTIAYIDGDRAVLLEGPPAGASVAATAVAEIYGIEGRIGPVGTASF